MIHSPSDLELWQAVVQGETSAFEQVVLRYQGLVSAIAYSRLGDFESSQDVAQETFWVAWSNRDQLREPERLAAWLCGIARNLSHQQSRAHSPVTGQSSLEQVESGSSQWDEAVKRDEAEVVWKAVEQLPDLYRETMVLYYRQEQSVAEVAGALELTEDAVKQRLSRARSMLREDLTSLVEETLVRSRPGKQFTTRVMSALVAMGAASVASTAKAATVASTPLAAGAVKSVVGVISPAVFGAAAGTAGGLVGTYLGGYLPAEFAPTMKQRDYMRMRARKMFIMSLVFTAVLIAMVNLLVTFKMGAVALLIVVFGWQAIFMSTCLIFSLATHRHIKAMQAAASPDDEANNSALRQRMVAAAAKFEGRSYTSRWTLASLPLVDIQISNPMAEFAQTGQAKVRVARGWIAVGDRAYGILVGVGGVATGLFASGGIAIGGIATGGLAIGVVAAGGGALGLLAIGGGAIGGVAAGGLAIGYHALGGGAFAWDSAVGGAAIAQHIAFGGYALAHDVAVGGGGGAIEFNTPAARQAVDQSGLKLWLDWTQANLTIVIVGMIAVTAIPNVLVAWLSTKKAKPNQQTSA